MSDHISKFLIEQFRDRSLDAATLGAISIHLEVCADCYELFCQALREKRASTSATFNFSSETWLKEEHVDYEHLVSFVDGALEAEDREVLDEHLSLCNRCREDVQVFIAQRKEIEPELNNVEQTLVRSTFTEETIAATVLQVKEAAGLRPIRQYIAELIFDSRLPPQLADARLSSTGAAVRRSLYRVEGYDIDLRFESPDENKDERLDGQVLPVPSDPTELPQFKVELLQDGSVLSTTHTNAHGEFEFDRLISGIYDLKISVFDGEINLERVPTARSL